MKDGILSWLPSIGQNLLAAAVLAVAVLLYRRFSSARKTAYRRDFEQAVTKMTALRMAGAAENSRLIVYVGSKLARLVGFGGVGVAAVLIAIADSLAGFSWSILPFEIIWFAAAAFALQRAVSTYVDITLLYSVYVEDNLTLPPEAHEVLKTKIEQHFEQLEKKRNNS